MALDIEIAKKMILDLISIRNPGNHQIEFDIDGSPKYFMLANLLKLKNGSWNLGKGEKNKMSASFENITKRNYFIMDTFKNKMTVGTFNKEINYYHYNFDYNYSN